MMSHSNKTTENANAHSGGHGKCPQPTPALRDPPNWPSKTGEKSGDGRDNNPPRDQR